MRPPRVRPPKWLDRIHIAVMGARLSWFTPGIINIHFKLCVCVCPQPKMLALKLCRSICQNIASSFLAQLIPSPARSPPPGQTACAECPHATMLSAAAEHNSHTAPLACPPPLTHCGGGRV